MLVGKLLGLADSDTMQSSNSFLNKITFPGAKRAEVIRFAQKEIMEYVSENILEATPESLSDPRYTPLEDMMQKYSRVVSGSFFILSDLVETLDKDVEIPETLLNAPKFWRMSTHELPLIRKSVLHFIKIACTRNQAIMDSRRELVAKEFLSKAWSEKDVTVFSELFEAIVSFAKRAYLPVFENWTLTNSLPAVFPDAWDLASAKKPIVPKIASFYKSVAQALPEVTYPSLLPVLASLPESQLDATKVIFGNIWSAFETAEAPSYTFMLNAYCECLVFSLVRAVKMENYLFQNWALELGLWNAIYFALVSAPVRHPSPYEISFKQPTDILLETSELSTVKVPRYLQHRRETFRQPRNQLSNP